MIHYHGGPFVSENKPKTAAAAWTAKHACISFADPSQVEIAAEVAQSFFFDNGAFPIWRTTGGQIDACAYLAWVNQWRQHPGFDFCLIPDVIDGHEADNDRLLAAWPLPPALSVPVWHLHEPLDRLAALVAYWPRVALGSSGDYSRPGSARWWNRMAEAMEIACDDQGRPKTKLHGLRMLDPTIFSHLPLASADSTNVAITSSRQKDWSGPYKPVTAETRALVLAERIERHASAARWNGSAGIQKNLELIG